MLLENRLKIIGDFVCHLSCIRFHETEGPCYRGLSPKQYVFLLLSSEKYIVQGWFDLFIYLLLFFRLEIFLLLFLFTDFPLL